MASKGAPIPTLRSAISNIPSKKLGYPIHSPIGHSRGGGVHRDHARQGRSRHHGSKGVVIIQTSIVHSIHGIDELVSEFAFRRLGFPPHIPLPLSRLLAEGYRMKIILRIRLRDKKKKVKKNEKRAWCGECLKRAALCVLCVNMV